MPSGELKTLVSEAELHAYVDGELDRARQNAVGAHLAVSPVDSARVENWRRQIEAIRAAFPPTGTAQLPWAPLLLPEHGSGVLRERWLVYPVAIAFAAGVFLTGSAIFVAFRLNWLQISPPTSAALTSVVAATDSPGRASKRHKASSGPGGAGLARSIDPRSEEEHF
jgi:anti-sigma factor RsiW